MNFKILSLNIYLRIADGSKSLYLNYKYILNNYIVRNIDQKRVRMIQL